MKKLLLALSAVALVAAGCPSAPSANIQPSMSVTETAVHEGDLYGSFFIKNPAPSGAPGLVIVHEWWGLNDQIKDEARKLADQGYAVFAIDMYDGEVAKDAARAGELAGKVRGNPSDAERIMKLALDFLEKQSSVDKTRLASLGWCFGGGMSNILASSGDQRLKASVVYYGTPTTDAERLKNMSRPILGIWGEDDQSVKAADVRAFEEKLKAQGTPVEFHYYAGAGHAFANPTRGDAYRPEATADAWQKTLDFLKRELGS
jgi:carboxymethylenebutenolidase